MQTEMLRFVNNMHPYNHSKCEEIFAERIIEIWDNNEDKFVHNMENKEKGVMDFFSMFKK